MSMPSAGPLIHSSPTARASAPRSWRPWRGSSRRWPGAGACKERRIGSSHSSSGTRRPRASWGSSDVTSTRSPLAGDLLVVDDNRVNRLLLGRALEQLGHAVTFAQNGREAVESLRKSRVDLVLLDIEMPEMNGYEVLAALASDPHLRDVPVVM